MRDRSYKPPKPAPKYGVRLSERVHLQPLNFITSRFGVSPASVYRWLAELGVPTISIGDMEYFNLYALTHALYLVTQVGGPGFLCFGSAGKRAKAHDRPNAPHLTRLTPEIVLELSRLDPNWQVREAVAKALDIKKLREIAAKLPSAEEMVRQTQRSLADVDNSQ